MENIKDSLATASVENDIKNGQVLCCLRLGITGVAVTPGGAYEIAEILGKEETLKRIEFSINLLSDKV